MERFPLTYTVAAIFAVQRKLNTCGTTNVAGKSLPTELRPRMGREGIEPSFSLVKSQMRKPTFATDPRLARPVFQTMDMPMR